MILVEIAGFLGADPEERFTATGKRVVSFRVGVKVRQNGKEEVTVWWRVSIWGDRFDKMLPYLKKGSAVIVVGDMSKPELYVDREGKTQIALNLQAEMIKFSPFGRTQKPGEGQQQESSSEYRSSYESAHATSEDKMAVLGPDEESEEIPF